MADPINLGDLTKPATVLIEKISDAIGGIFKPHQIRRIAEAKAEADKIRAISQMEILALGDRAVGASSSKKPRSSTTLKL